VAKQLEEHEIEGAANVLLEAKRIKKTPKLKRAALALIRKRQKIATLVLTDN